MHFQEIISTNTVEHLKQKARKLKRDQAITHVQALDEIAKSHGFNHWHHVTLSNDIIKPSEEALRSGCVLAFDIEDALKLDMSNPLVTLDHSCLEWLIGDMSFEVSTTPNDDEQHEQLNVNGDYIYCRLDASLADESLEDILDFIRQNISVMPRVLWLKGKRFDTHCLPS